MRTIGSLVAAMVAVMLFAVQGWAADYEFRLCDEAGKQCSGNYPEKFGLYEPGDLVSFFIDVDEIVADDLCRVEYWVVYDSGQMEFLDAKRVQADPETPVACTTDPNLYIPPGCSQCDTEVHCVMEDFFKNAHPAKIENPAEMELIFRLNAFNDARRVTGLFRDWFYVDRWTTEGGCGEVVDSGPGSRPMGVVVRMVPEPAQVAGLVACVPLLWGLGRLRARRNQ